MKKEYQSVVNTLHGALDMPSLLSTVAVSSPQIQDKDAAAYMTLLLDVTKKIAESSGADVAATQNTVLNVIKSGGRLGWLAEFKLSKNFETLKETIIKTSSTVSDKQASFYMEDLKGTMRDLGFNMDPSTDDRADREPAHEIFAVLYGTVEGMRSLDLQYLAVTEIGQRAGANKGLWSQVLADLDRERQGFLTPACQ